MTDDNIQELPKNNNKNPVDNAINKLKETATNEINKKIGDQVKVIINAIKILKTEKFKLQELRKEAEVEKAEFSELMKEFK